MTCVIVLSGAEGAGKSTLAKGLMERFKGKSNRVIAIDDYSGSNHWYPDWLSQGGDRLFAVKKWRDAGCNPDKAVYTPDLKQELLDLKSRGELDYIFLEEPFGKLRKEIRSLIDVSIHIHIPLDIALARGAINNAANGIDPIEYLENYMRADLRALHETQNTASKKADLVVDGLQPVGKVANEAADFIKGQIAG